MIALLQRQQVRKRGVPPVRMRARNTGVRWQKAGISVPAGAHGARPFPAPAARTLRPKAPRKSLVERITGRRLQPVRLAAQLAAQKPARAPRPPRLHPAPRQLRREQAGFLRKPGFPRQPGLPQQAGRPLVRAAWVVTALAVVLAAFLLAPAWQGLQGRLPRGRPSLPEPEGIADALYRAAVPEEPARPATTARPPSVTGVQLAEYRVRKGDSLSLVAQRHRLSLGTVISWNDIRDGRSLSPGSLLTLPNADGLKYRVRRGDTLEGIARSAGIPLNDILDWNGLASAVITVGQVLFLPGARLSQSDISRVTGSLFIYPVRGRLSSTFGSRSDPFTGVVRFHNGVDLVARRGTAVGAAMTGTVAAIGFNANYGRYIFLQHPGYQTMYAHLDRITVSTGQRVAQGQKVGELGNTGYSTGPHLHFSIYRGAEPVDPLALLK